MSSYGPPILGSGVLGRLARPRNRLLTRTQYRLLDFFDTLPPALARAYSAMARRLVGGYLYSIKVELNEACTLRCKMCYVPGDRHELEFGLVKSLLDQVKGLGVRIELLGGEPLEYKSIADLVCYAKFVTGSPLVSLYTNGLDASPEMSAQLKSAGLDAAIVSLISHRPEVHDDFTGVPGSWQRTRQGILNLRSAGVKVYTFSAIHCYNAPDYQEIDRFVRSGLDARALFYQYIPQVPNDPLMIPPRTWHDIKHWVLYDANPVHMDLVRKFFMLTGNACSGGNFVLTVKADGSVQPCPFVSDLPLGNIRETDIWTIYRNRYRNTALAELKQVPEECRDCSYSSVCGGGCRAGNRVLFGSYARRDPRCLGPWHEPIDKRAVTDHVPCFF